MADYVDRDLLLKVLIHRVKGNEDNCIVLGTNNTLAILEEWVRSVSAVDAVEVVHGRWRPLEYDGYADGNPVWDLWECSECQEEHSGDEDSLTPYCPNCGAKMDGDGNG